MPCRTRVGGTRPANTDTFKRSCKTSVQDLLLDRFQDAIYWCCACPSCAPLGPEAARDLGAQKNVTSASAVRPSPSRRARVTRRGDHGSDRRAMARPIALAPGPLSRTTPTPLCPGGVATATIVSSVGYTPRLDASAERRVPRLYLAAEMMTIFSKVSPMLSVDTDGTPSTAICTMRRS